LSAKTSLILPEEGAEEVPTTEGNEAGLREIFKND
jgi:hypothetical protein